MQAGDGADFRVPGPDFSDQALHWQVHLYVWRQTSTDPGDGKKTIGDVWVRFGPQNKLLAARSITTYEDGTLRSAELALPGQVINIHGQPIAPNLCRSAGTGASADLALESFRPLYANLTWVAGAGLHPAENKQVVPPPLPERTDVQAMPETVINPVASLQWWEGRLAGPGDKTTDQRIQVDRLSGLVVADNVEERDSSGKLTYQSQLSLSAIEVYTASDVPASLFAPGSLPEECPR